MQKSNRNAMPSSYTLHKTARQVHHPVPRWEIFRWMKTCDWGQSALVSHKKSRLCLWSLALLPFIYPIPSICSIYVIFRVQHPGDKLSSFPERHIFWPPSMVRLVTAPHGCHDRVKAFEYVMLTLITPLNVGTSRLQTAHTMYGRLCSNSIGR